MNQSKKTGNLGEQLAEKLLRQKKHRILARNLKTSFGEIDLLTQDKQTIVLVEVKAKRGLHFGLPQEMIHAHKQYKLRQLAGWLSQRYPNRQLRIDVVAVYLGEGEPKLEHLENVLEG